MKGVQKPGAALIFSMTIAAVVPVRCCLYYRNCSQRIDYHDGAWLFNGYDKGNNTFIGDLAFWYCSQIFKKPEGKGQDKNKLFFTKRKILLGTALR